MSCQVIQVLINFSPSLKSDLVKKKKKQSVNGCLKNYLAYIELELSQITAPQI